MPKWNRPRKQRKNLKKKYDFAHFISFHCDMSCVVDFPVNCMCLPNVLSPSLVTLTFQPNEFNCVNKYAWCAFVCNVYCCIRYIFFLSFFFFFLFFLCGPHYVCVFSHFLRVAYDEFVVLSCRDYFFLFYVARFYLFIVFIFVNEKCNPMRCDTRSQCLLRDEAAEPNQNDCAFNVGSLMYLYTQ